MRIYLIPFFLFVSMLASWACKRNGTTAPSSSQDTMWRIHIDYAERIEGYTVSADVFLTPGYKFDNSGSVELHFTKGASSIDLRVDDILLPDYLDPDTNYVDGQTVIRHYSPPPAADTLSCDHPFFFYDVDFDGKKEILVASPWGGPRGNRAYFAFEDTGKRLEDEPLDRLDSDSRFSAREKSITQNYSYGMILGDVILKYTRQFDGSFRVADSTHIVYPTENECYIRYHYRRKGDKMVLVDSTIVK